MKPGELVQAIFYPLTETAVVVPLIVFWLLMSLAQIAGLLGVLLSLIVMLAVYRFQMIILEARAMGRTPTTPDIEFFSWFGQWWSVFPLPMAIFIAWATIVTGENFGVAAAVLVLMFAGAIWPASLAVLAITHSPLQSVNPFAVGALLKRCGDTFWMASVFLVVAGWVSLLAISLPPVIANFIQLLLTFSFFSVTGSLIRPYDLIGDVRIPESPPPAAGEVDAHIEKGRTETLTHAYGFMSRGNREGGFKHVVDWIDRDPDPVAAWKWFFERMLRWEEQEHALFFAQHYLHDMLQHGEKVPAVKLMMRCRLIDASFRPERSDLPAAIEAAESSGNNELAAVLRRW